MPQNKRPEKSELLMPAGSLQKMKTAVLYGADALYAGTPDLSLRTKSKFSLEELKEGIDFAHEHGARVYLTLNLFSHNKDIEKLPKFIETIKQVKPDGVIMSDPGVYQYVNTHAPELEKHISTQANVCSWLTVQYWEKQGADLVVLAREVSMDEAREIREKCPNVKLETFVHGAMCMTYSGRCLLSNYLSERGANQGNCAQSCRWNYKVHVQMKDGTIKELKINEQNKDLFEFYLEEEYRPGQLMPIQEDMRGSYILNSKDLCLLPKLPELIGVIDSLKIEGRNKTQYYAAMVARAYRHAIDSYYKDHENWDPEPYMQELYTLQNRGYTLGFHEGRLSHLAHNYESAKSVAQYQFSGFVREWQGDDMILELKNEINSGEVIEFLSPHVWDPIRLRSYEFRDADSGEITHKVSAGQEKAIRINKNAFHNETDIQSILPEFSVARKGVAVEGTDETRRKMDIIAQNVENGKQSYEEYLQAKEALDAQKEDTKKARNPNKQGPKIGTQGCCGRGCNGCLIFWKDPKFEKAREQMQSKSIGEKL